jgi:hypothetical protein
MQAPILQKEKWTNATLNRDRWRDLLMIDHFEAIKHELISFMINMISIFIIL